MYLVYDAVNVNAYLASGLLEKPKANKSRTQQLELINSLIEGLRTDIGNFYKKMKISSAKEAMERAKEDPEIDNKIRDWMEKIYLPQTKSIMSEVENFNKKYAPNYEKLISKEA